MKRWLGIAVGSVLAAALWGGPSWAGEGSDPASGYAQFKQQERARAGDPEFDYAPGIAAIDAGHASDAVAAPERVLPPEWIARSRDREDRRSFALPVESGLRVAAARRSATTISIRIKLNQLNVIRVPAGTSGVMFAAWPHRPCARSVRRCAN